MDITTSPRTPRQRRHGPNMPNARTSPKLGDFSLLKRSCITPITPMSLEPGSSTNVKSTPTAQPLSERPAQATKRASKLFDLDHPIFARLQISSRSARLHEHSRDFRRSEDPPSPSPVTGELATSRQENSQQVDPYISATEDDIPLEDSDAFMEAASRSSTPATSPATSVNHHVEQDAEDPSVSTRFIMSSFQLETVLQSKQPNNQISVPPLLSTRKAFLDQLPKNPRSWNQLQRLDRIRVADIVAAARESGTMTDEVVLPWDMDGNFLEPRLSASRTTIVPRDSIEPLYRVSYKTKLQILKAAMKNTYDEDARIQAHPWSQAVTNEPLHVYVDLSNIIIGFYNHIKTRRFMPADSRTRAPPFSFHAFAAAVERGRPCAKRAIAGSVRAASGVPAYMLEAEGLGYEMNILQRVRGTKKSVHNLFVDPSAAINNPYNLPMPFFSNYISDSEDGGGNRPGWREQAVDEILHLKMMQSLLDTAKPATVVLCTGDAAEAEFSDGFLRNVERALSRGWYVEVVGWRDTMADAWFEKGFRKKHGWRFRTVVLDELVEELLAVYA